jgi:pSer/pThr/pTyr-binding forkhead associated (FHA) protein
MQVDKSYTIPSWSGTPSHHFTVEILKEGMSMANLP